MINAIRRSIANVNFVEIKVVNNDQRKILKRFFLKFSNVFNKRAHRPPPTRVSDMKINLAYMFVEVKTLYILYS